MKTIHVLTTFDYPHTPYWTEVFTAGRLVEVDEDCAAFAVAKGLALFADFAEDDLLDRSQAEADNELVHEIVQSFRDADLDNEADEREHG